MIVYFGVVCFDSNYTWVPLKVVEKSWQLHINALYWVDACVDPDRGGGGCIGSGPTEKHKSIGFLSNAGPDPLKNHKAIPSTKPEFNVGLSLARQRNAISLADR